MARRTDGQTDSRQTRRKISFLVSHLHCAIVHSHCNCNCSVDFDFDFHFPVALPLPQRQPLPLPCGGVRVKVKSVCTFTHAYTRSHTHVCATQKYRLVIDSLIKTSRLQTDCGSAAKWKKICARFS